MLGWDRVGEGTDPIFNGLVRRTGGSVRQEAYAVLLKAVRSVGKVCERWESTCALLGRSLSTYLTLATTLRRASSTVRR